MPSTHPDGPHSSLSLVTAARYAPRFEPELESAMLKSIKVHVGFAARRGFTLGEEARRSPATECRLFPLAPQR